MEFEECKRVLSEVKKHMSEHNVRTIEDVGEKHFLFRCCDCEMKRILPFECVNRLYADMFVKDTPVYRQLQDVLSYADVFSF